MDEEKSTEHEFSAKTCETCTKHMKNGGYCFHLHLEKKPCEMMYDWTPAEWFLKIYHLEKEINHYKECMEPVVGSLQDIVENKQKEYVLVKQRNEQLETKIARIKGICNSYGINGVVNGVIGNPLVLINQILERIKEEAEIGKYNHDCLASLIIDIVEKREVLSNERFGDWFGKSITKRLLDCTGMKKGEHVPCDLIQDLTKKLSAVARLWVIFRDEYKPDGPGGDEMNGLLEQEIKENDDKAMEEMKIS